MRPFELKMAPRRALAGALLLYKRGISPLMPRACRFFPTCSEYAYQSIERHGILKGSAYALRRLLKCHPFHPGGYDPVP
jgi:uncharacterized protein